MPPDITTGLMALAGPQPPTGPPGATGTPAAPICSVRAALFASLLTQSSLPTLQLAAPKTDAAPTIKLGFAAKQQTSKTPKIPGILKTMDTLPALSFPAAGTGLKASELLPSRLAGRKTAANDKTAAGDTAAGDTQNAVDLTAARTNGPNGALAPAIVSVVVPVQAVILPLLMPAAAPAPSPPRASEIAAPLAVSAIPELPERVPTSFAKVSPPTLPAPNALLTPNTPFVLVGSPQAQSARLTIPAPAFLPPDSLLLPQTPSQVPPSSAPQVLPLPAEVPQMADQVASARESVPTAFKLGSAENTAGSLQALPHTVIPGIIPSGRMVPQQPLSPAQSTLSLPPSAPLQAVPNAASAMGAFVQPSAAALPAAAPTPISSGPAKPSGKFVPTALKSAPVNADTYTRIADTKIEAKPMPTDAPAATAKVVLPAKLPQPNFSSRISVSERIAGAEAVDAKAETKVPTGMLETGVPAAQAAPLTAVPSGRLLSAADQVKIVHQVADGVGAMPLPAKLGGVQQMSLQLHPKDWGSLQVSVSVTPGQEAGTAKTVTAHIVAETPQVKAALQSQTGALHQALRASGLNLEHLTVSVKPAAETVKPAPQSASAGLSGGQGQPSGSSQTPPAHMAAGSQSAGMQFGTSAGSSQSGRQGQPPIPMSASAQAEAEEIAPTRQLTRPLGRIDTHA